MADPIESSTTDEIKKNLDKLTSNITYVVLIGFIVILCIILIKALTCTTDASGKIIGDEWLSLFRDGFLILSGILTTLIGYYFGNRGSDAALKQVEEIKRENLELEKSLKSASPTNEEQDASIESIEPLNL